MVESRLSTLQISGEDHVNETSNNNVVSSPAITTIPTSSILSKIHPLKNRWTLWFLNSKKDLDWLDRLKKVCTIDTVEDFWALYDNIRPPSVLTHCDYNLFKEGIDPMWEVPENKNGGRLLVVVERGRNDLLDALWLELLLSLIGNQYGDDCDSICGAVCNIRQKNYKICLWTKNAKDIEANKRIGMIMKARMTSTDVPGAKMLKVVYEDHSDVQNKQSSAIKTQLQI